MIRNSSLRTALGLVLCCDLCLSPWFVQLSLSEPQTLCRLLRVLTTNRYVIHCLRPHCRILTTTCHLCQQTEQALQEHKQQSKLIFRRITPNAEPRCSIESGPYTLQFVFRPIPLVWIFLKIFFQLPHCGQCGVPYHCRQVVPTKARILILRRTFQRVCQHLWPKGGDRPETIRIRWFWSAFLFFLLFFILISCFSDTFMSKTARLYRDTRTANAASSGLDRLNDDLQDVTRIMTKNMEELLWRGDSLDSTSATPIHACLVLTTFLRNVTFVHFSSVRV